MKLLSFLKRGGSAPIARERLKILLAHERQARNQPELLDVLREEILSVIAKHVPLDRDRVQVKMDRGKGVSMLEVEIEVPHDFDAAVRGGA